MRNILELRMQNPELEKLWNKVLKPRRRVSLVGLAWESTGNMLQVRQAVPSTQKEILQRLCELMHGRITSVQWRLWCRRTRMWQIA